MVNYGYIFGGAMAVSSLAGFAIAHPGENHDMDHIKRQVDARQLRAAAAKRSLANCQSSLKHRELMQRSVQRRAQALHDLREKRGINAKSKKFRRDLAALQRFEAVNHNQTALLDYSIDTPESSIFAANTSSILTPESTDGPYYVVGELIRQDVKEDQTGIDLYLEVQYIDVTTCEPVPDLYIDFWSCNATGVYSGVEGEGGLNTTFLRGIQKTDEDGVVTFDSIFPGHYAGRAVHTHLLTKSNVTLYDNGTTTGGEVNHIGQLLYPETLIAAVEATAPYNTNKQVYVPNDADQWSIAQAENNYDPFPEFIYLGDDITDGLLAWIQIGINTTADYTNDKYNYDIAATYQAGGGVTNPDSAYEGGVPKNLTGWGPKSATSTELPTSTAAV